LIDTIETNGITASVPAGMEVAPQVASNISFLFHVKINDFLNPVMGQIEKIEVLPEIIIGPDLSVGCYQSSVWRKNTVPVKIEFTITQNTVISAPIEKNKMFELLIVFSVLKGSYNFFVIAPIKMGDAELEWDSFPQFGTVDVHCKHTRRQVTKMGQMIWPPRPCEKEETCVCFVKNDMVEPHMRAFQIKPSLQKNIVDLSD
jgi:hypothetical protein